MKTRFGYADNYLSDVDLRTFTEEVVCDLDRRARLTKCVFFQWQESDEIDDGMLQQSVLDLIHHIIEAKDAFYARAELQSGGTPAEATS